MRSWLRLSASGLALLAGLMFTTGTASAAPTLWPVSAGGNGHFYEVVDTATTWDQAKAAAEASTHLGVQGHLVTITSSEENAFVAGLTGSLAWIGYNDISDEGSFVWVTGEPTTYTNWAGGEPNNQLGTEDCVEFNRFGVGLWNDLPCSGFPRIYVIEYDMPQPVTFDDCKKGGWQGLFDGEGNSFKNQGDCVSYVATGGKNTGAVAP